MDEIVREAMRKWPDVPHCFGWLSLDARGRWRMRDERAQELDLPGDNISHPALLAFINRNYACDAAGQWYFQNGPQRVYVDLELTPYVVHTDPATGFVLHTGEPMPAPEAVWLTHQGNLLLQTADIVAALDDRDTAAVLSALSHLGVPAGDDLILEWLSTDLAEHRPELLLPLSGIDFPVQWIDAGQLASRFGFIAQPRKPTPP